MTGSSYLLDTSIVIDLFRGGSDTASFLINLSNVHLPIITLGELYVGAYRSINKPKSLKQIADFAGKHNILECDAGTAECYGEIKSFLFSTGRECKLNCAI